MDKSEELRSEIEALCLYVNRDIYSLNVVEAMINEIHNLVIGLQPPPRGFEYVETDWRK